MFVLSKHVVLAIGVILVTEELLAADDDLQFLKGYFGKWKDAKRFFLACAERCS